MELWWDRKERSDMVQGPTSGLKLGRLQLCIPLTSALSILYTRGFKVELRYVPETECFSAVDKAEARTTTSRCVRKNLFHLIFFFFFPSVSKIFWEFFSNLVFFLMHRLKVWIKTGGWKSTVLPTKKNLPTCLSVFLSTYQNSESSPSFLLSSLPCFPLSLSCLTASTISLTYSESFLTTMLIYPPGMR